MASGQSVEIRVDFYPNNHPTLVGKVSTFYPTNMHHVWDVKGFDSELNMGDLIKWFP